MKKISIDPITRLEGHGRIDLFLNENGELENAYLIIPELRGFDPPPAAKKLRELLYSSFFVADHATHFYVLAAPDFVVGPDAPKAERNILGLVRKVGKEIGARVIQLLQENHEIAAIVAGRYIHSVSCIIGGMSKPITEEERDRIVEIAENSVETAKFSLQLFEDVVLKNPAYLDMILSDAFTHKTYYMGLVDEKLTLSSPI